MRSLTLATLIALLAGTPVAAQTPPQTPPQKLAIAMRIEIDDTMKRDSAAIGDAVKAAIKADTAYEFVDRVPVSGELLRGIRMVLTLSFVEAGGRLLTTLRIFDAPRRTVVATENLQSSRGDLVKSLPAAVQKALTAAKP